MKEELLDKIEAYLNGDMTPKAEAAFDAAIEKDAELAAAVDNFGVANDALEILIEDNLRKELEAMSQEQASSSNVVSINKKQPVARMRNLRTYLAAAASVALLVGFIGWNWASSNFTNSALSNEFSSEYQMPNVRAGNSVVNAFADGINAYNAQNYAEANQFFSSVVVDDPRYAEAQFYLGHTLLAQEKAAEAAQQFQKVAAMQDVRYTESAEWHQVVAQLQADDTGNAFNSLLTKIASDESHAFNGQAKALQTKINSFWRKLVK